MNHLRAWLDAQDLSFHDAAGLIGASVPMLSLIAAGKRNPSPRMKVKIARGLGAAIGDLFPPESIPDDQVAS